MLRILKRIKHGKPAGNNAEAFWRFAIAEFFLVFLGILIALQVDNWNQDRKDRKLERVLLSEMLGNLRADLEDLNQNIQALSERTMSNQLVLDFLESETPWYDSLGFHFSRLMGGTVFMKNSSAYQNLESIGLNFVRDDSLRSEITALYSSYYPYLVGVEEWAADFRANQFTPIIAKELDILGSRNVVPLDVKRLRLHSEFKQYSRMNLLHLENSKYTSELTKQRVLDLIKHLEIELGLEPGESN